MTFKENIMLRLLQTVKIRTVTVLRWGVRARERTVTMSDVCPTMAERS